MQWKIGLLVFCEQKQEIEIDGQTVKLESMASQVLDYFCQHPNRVISRDELIEQVWTGQVITDNAVNRVIARLRKALNDDAKNSQYIVTVPKKGYRFIAPVEEVIQPSKVTPVKGHGDENVTRSPVASASIATKYRWLIGALIALMSVFYFTASYSPVLDPQQAGTQLTIHPLTRDRGAEHGPALSPDENWLVFTRFDQGVLNMYLKDIQTGQVQRVSDGKGNSGAASWSHDGLSLVYLYTAEGICQYRIKGFEQGQFTSEKIVYNCPNGSFGQALFSHNGAKLLFAQRETSSSPYWIYVLDLSSNTVMKPRQPEAYLGGHSEFDLHPSKDWLLVSSPNELQQISVSRLDLDNNRYEALFHKGGYVCCAIWGHEGQSVVMMGPYPATQINQYDLSGNRLNTLVSTSQTLGPPQRIANGEDYVFTGAQHNIGLRIVAPDGSSQAFNISSVEENLPTMAGDRNTLGFISNQSGQEQVWTMDLASGNKKRISRFADNHKYFDLRWSPSQNSIALLKIDGVRLLHPAGQTFRDLPLPKAEIRGMSWVSDNTLAFSLRTNSGWRVHHYDLQSDTLRQIDYPWQFAKYHPEVESTISFNLQGQVHLNGRQMPLALRPPLGRDRRFAFELFADTLYFQRRSNGKSQLFASDLVAFDAIPLYEHQLMFAFTVSDQGNIVSVLDASEQDVLRTRRQ